MALPQVDQPVAWSLPAMFNPSFPFLLFHRTFGNFSYVMLLTGGVLDAPILLFIAELYEEVDAALNDVLVVEPLSVLLSCHAPDEMQ